MTNGYLKPGFGGWPPGMPTFSKLASTLNLYLDPVAGNDDRPGTSREQAVKTAARIADLIALAPGNVDVHMRSGTATLPARGWFLRPRIMQGLVRFFADELWDPTVFTVVGGNRTAAAATTDVVVKAAGLVVDALKGLTMRFTSGPAAGQYRTIRNNTATDIIPVAAFTVAPDPGDTYQVFTRNCSFALPTNGGTSVASYQFTGDNACGANVANDYFPGSPAPQVVPSGVVLDSIDLKGSADYTNYAFGAGAVYLYGVTAAADFLSSQQFVYSRTSVFLGWGLGGAYDNKAGYTLNSFSLGRSFDQAYATGYWYQDNTHGLDCGALQFALYGGRAAGIWIVPATGARGVPVGQGAVTGDAINAIPFLIDANNAAVAIVIDGPGCLSLGNVIVQNGAIQIGERGVLLITDETTGDPGASGITIVMGGAVLCVGAAVNLGGAGNDYAVTGVAAFNKSALTAGTPKFGTDGSLAMLNA